MNIFELEDQMENGFHDSLINNIDVDYQNMVLTLELDVLTGLSDDNYEKKVVVIEDLQLLFIEPSMASNYSKPWVTDFGNYIDLKDKPIDCKKQIADPDIFICYFFISNWNSFIVIAGKHCRIK